MRSHLVVISAPSFAFLDRVVEAHESVLVQALRSELAVEGLDERIVRRLARSAEVQFGMSRSSVTRANSPLSWRISASLPVSPDTTFASCRFLAYSECGLTRAAARPPMPHTRVQ